MSSSQSLKNETFLIWKMEKTSLEWWSSIVRKFCFFQLGIKIRRFFLKREINLPMQIFASLAKPPLQTCKSKERLPIFKLLYNNYLHNQMIKLVNFLGHHNLINHRNIWLLIVLTSLLISVLWREFFGFLSFHKL